MGETENNNGPIGVLVVHGIGAQERGETLAKLLGGLRRAAPNLPTDDGDGVAGEIEGQALRFYEVYWADLLKGDQVRSTFLMSELQSLSWFPWLNFSRRVYPQGSYSFFTVAPWVLMLPVINWLLLLAYFGARLFVQVFFAVFKKRPPPGSGSLAARVRKASARSKEYTLVDRLLDEYVADVINYVNSAGGAFHRNADEPAVPAEVQNAYPAIVARFHAQLIRAHADGCERIQVVSHSLGTVVMYHALRGLNTDFSGPGAAALRAAAARVEHLYTIGSPLEKIRFFWPRLMPVENLAGSRDIAWDNFVSWFDPVAGVLRGFMDWGGVSNHRLLGGGFISGHVVYERSPVFLATLTRGLCGSEISMKRSPLQRLRDSLFLAGESLLAPGGLLLLLAGGAAILALTILILPYLISLPFRLFSGPEVWGPILDWAALIVGAMMILALTLAPLIRASRAHRLFWSRRSQPPD